MVQPGLCGAGFGSELGHFLAGLAVYTQTQRRSMAWSRGCVVGNGRDQKGEVGGLSVDPDWPWVGRAEEQPSGRGWIRDKTCGRTGEP